MLEKILSLFDKTKIVYDLFNNVFTNLPEGRCDNNRNCGPLPCLTIRSKLHNRWNVDLTNEVVVPYSLRTAVWTNLLEIKVNGFNAIEN